MSTFISKIESDCLYRAILSSKIEYHAGLFFVYKEIAYLRFYLNGELKFYTRVEGQRPDDINYSKVYDLIGQSESDVQTAKFTEIEWNRMIVKTILKRNGNDIEFYIMPSILTENIEGVKLTELILDSQSSENKITEVYNRIDAYDLIK